MQECTISPAEAQQERLARGLAIQRTAGQVHTNGAVGTFYVASQSTPGHQYIVATPWAKCGPRCGCQDFAARGLPCKHLYAASLHYAGESIRAKVAKGQSLAQIEGWLLGIGCAGVPAEHELAWAAFWWACQTMLGEEV
jgi:hypothetical protein